MISSEMIKVWRKNRKGLKGNPLLTSFPSIGAALRLLTYIIIVFFLYTCAENKYYLSNASSSIEDICTRVLEALYHKDIKGLEAIAISEEEYRNYIWPQSPVYNIKQWQEHYDFIWDQHYSRSRYSLSQMFSKYGGKKYTLVGVWFAEGTTDHKTYRAYRDCRLSVTNSEGKAEELNLFGSIIEMGGQFKIISFKTH